MSHETLTITDNRTGKSYEIPIEHGAIAASALRQIKIDEDDAGLFEIATVGHIAGRDSADVEVREPDVVFVTPGPFTRAIVDARDLGPEAGAVNFDVAGLSRSSESAEEGEHLLGPPQTESRD